MPLTDEEMKELADNATFKAQIEVAIVDIAQDVIGETPASPANEIKDDTRHALGMAVIADIGVVDSPLKKQFALMCTVNNVGLVSVGTKNTYQAVKDSVSAVWNDVAGLKGKDA